MEIEKSSIWREVQAVINSGSNPVHYVWTCKIYANGKTYQPLKVVEIDIIRNYEDNFGDEMMVKLEISGGMYASNIYPYKEDIEILMIKQPLMEGSDQPDPMQKKQSERFRATLKDTGNPLVEGHGANSSTQTNLDLANSFPVEFQLVNKAIEQIRMIATGGIYRDTTADKVIKTVLTQNAKVVEVEGVRSPKGVDMIAGSNTTVRDHIIIPQGVPTVKIPEYIHEKCGGVYPSGMGYYYQGDYWYVYPCYDPTRWATAPKNLTVLNIPENKLPGIERTYRKDGNTLVVLATGKVQFRDDSEVRLQNHGNGARWASASNLMGEVVKVAKNVATMSRGANNTEVISVPRKSGLNFVKVSSTEITDNSFLQYSALARRQGSVLTFAWENADTTLIFPGMMAKIKYLENDTIKELYGVVLGAHHFTKMKGQGMTDGRHITNSTISIFTKRIETS